MVIMDRASAREYIKAKIDCRQFLERSQGGLFCCPSCGSGHGPHHTGALKYYPETNKCHCFACNETFDVLDLYGIKNKTDYSTSLRDLAHIAGISTDHYSDQVTGNIATRSAADAGQQKAQSDKTAQDTPEGRQSDFDDECDNSTGNEPKVPTRAAQSATDPLPEEQPADYTDYYRQCRERLEDPRANSYLSARGISVETAARYWIGFDPEADPASNPGGMGKSKHPCPRIILPTSKRHYVGRSIDQGTPKEYQKMNCKGGKPGLFNYQTLFTPDVQEVFIVEGAFDALSIIEAGAAAVALNSTSNADALIKLLEKTPTTATLILCCDNDDAGKKANDALRDGLQRLNISHITGNICGGYKDPNEYLQADKTGFIEAIQTAQRQAAAKPDNVSDYIAQLMGTDIERFKDDIKTGFSNLDAKAGGLYTGLYTVAAISSLGKTTFCAQLADQLAAAGHDVIFFSLEQSRLEMVSKSIARITTQKDAENAVTSLQIRKGKGGQIAQDAAKEYIKRVGDRLSVVEGNFNCNISFIGDYIRQYIRRNNTRPVVFIDYLQILQPEQIGNRQQTTKEMVDSTVTELKRLSREMNLTIFIISSVNRANYLTPIDFESLKESGGIEFTSDVIWGLQLQCLNEPLFTEANKIKEKRDRVKQAKAENPRKIELSCLKNRYGIANFACSFDYFPANDLFRENDAAADFIPADEEATQGFIL